MLNGLKQSPKKSLKKNPKARQRTEIKKLLQNVFKLRHFRPGQLEIIESVLDRKDTIAILPTGAGKSLCYQLPALMTKGTAIVVSPLISLMKDQKDKLDSLDIPSVILNSSILETEQRESLIAIKRGETEFVYVTPERLTNPEFLESIGKTKIDLLVIDEAHCVTQWGHDFRPAYLGIADVREKLGHPPILALTATATAEVIDDISLQLKLATPSIIFTSVFRKNLVYSAFVTESEEEKQLRLFNTLKEKTEDGSVIVYSSTVKGVEEISERLTTEGIENCVYHGKLPRKEKTGNQDSFLSGNVKVMVATTAFGMGIDKPDIRTVIHYNFPGTIESYYQESGRAGRDGLTANCMLYYLKKDKGLQTLFKSGKYPTPKHVALVLSHLPQTASEIDFVELAKASGVPKTKIIVLLQTLRDLEMIDSENQLARPLTAADIEKINDCFAKLKSADDEKLRDMIIYSQTALCRWSIIMKYFGEEPEWKDCGLCDNCRGHSTRMSIEHPLQEESIAESASPLEAIEA